MSEKNKLTKIRSAIDSALIANGLEGTRELKKGCRMEISTNNGYGGTDIICKNRVLDAIQCKQEEKPSYLIGAYEGERGLIQPREELILGLGNIGAVFKIDKIIGRDITISDCLIALNENRPLTKSGYIDAIDSSGEFITICGNFITICGNNESWARRPQIKWQFGKPLHLQEEDVIDFIYSLICKENES